jgi:hypothetical protein
LLVEVWMVDSGGTEWLTAGSDDSGTVVLKPLWGGRFFRRRDKEGSLPLESRRLQSDAGGEGLVSVLPLGEADHNARPPADGAS